MCACVYAHVGERFTSFVCSCVLVYVRTRKHVRTHTCTRAHANVYKHAHTHTHTCVILRQMQLVLHKGSIRTHCSVHHTVLACVREYVFRFMIVLKYVCRPTHAYTHMYKFIYTHIHVHTHIHTHCTAPNANVFICTIHHTCACTCDV